MNKFFKSGKILGVILFSGMAWAAFGEAPVKYSEVEFVLSKVSIAQLGALGLPVDHHDANADGIFEMPVSGYDLDLLRMHGIPFRLLIDDYARFIEERNIRDAAEAKALAKAGKTPKPEIAVPLYFKHGSLGGYLNYAEIVKEIDEMRTRYPKLVSVKTEIGKTWENRSIWAIRISSSPDEELPNRPRIVYNNMTHAREPMAVMSMTWFIWSLLEGYTTNPEYKRILDNIDIHYIPVVNPDGYEYNRSTNPSGGGLWRKNRATNKDGTRGVDPNRNYSVNWGNDAGSSPDGSSDTHRGPNAFSEPESKAVRDYYLAKKFRISSNFHTFANKLLHPYGISGVPVNMVEYTALCQAMTKVNGWQWGRLPPTIGYSAAGVEIDWAHDVGKTLALNPEMGTAEQGGFWPPESSIDKLALAGFDMNLAMARFALPPITAIPFLGKQITKDFSFNIKGAPSGEWNIRYTLHDVSSKWTLRLRDLQGNVLRTYALPTSENSFVLSRNGLPQSLFILDVSSCNEKGCRTVYNRKLAPSAI